MARRRIDPPSKWELWCSDHPAISDAPLAPDDSARAHVWVAASAHLARILYAQRFGEVRRTSVRMAVETGLPTECGETMARSFVRGSVEQDMASAAADLSFVAALTKIVERVIAQVTEVYESVLWLAESRAHAEQDLLAIAEAVIGALVTGRTGAIGLAYVRSNIQTRRRLYQQALNAGMSTSDAVQWASDISRAHLTAREAAFAQNDVAARVSAAGSEEEMFAALREVESRAANTFDADTTAVLAGPEGEPDPIAIGAAIRQRAETRLRRAQGRAPQHEARDRNVARQLAARNTALPRNGHVAADAPSLARSDGGADGDPAAGEAHHPATPFRARVARLGLRPVIHLIAFAVVTVHNFLAPDATRLRTTARGRWRIARQIARLVCAELRRRP